MELLALVVFNLVFGVAFYYFISIKVNNSIQNYQSQKLKKEIQAHILNFYKESENYLALMDSKILILKNLLARAESIGLDITKEKSSTIESAPVSVEESESLQKEIIPIKSEIDVPKKSPGGQLQYQPSFLRNLFAGTGKALMSIVGMPESKEELVIEEEKKTPLQPLKPLKTNSLDLSIGGNPLKDETRVYTNIEDENNFQSLLNANQKGYNNKSAKDSKKISIQATLKELPEDLGKVEKVVYLLQKGYHKEDISQELELSLSEVNLIETIKIEKTAKRKG